MPTRPPVAVLLEGSSSGGAWLLLAAAVLVCGGGLWLLLRVAIDPRAGVACDRLDAARRGRRAEEDDEPWPPDASASVYLRGGDVDWSTRADAGY